MYFIVASRHYGFIDLTGNGPIGAIKEVLLIVRWYIVKSSPWWLEDETGVEEAGGRKDAGQMMRI